MIMVDSLPTYVAILSWHDVTDWLSWKVLLRELIKICIRSTAVPHYDVELDAPGNV